MAEATVIAVEYDLIVPQRATLREKFELPFDGRGKVFAAQAWTTYDKTQLICEFEIEIVQLTPTTILYINADWQDLVNVSGSGYWDFAVDNEDGTRDHWLKGKVCVDRRVT